MSADKLQKEATRWLAQARDDLEAAQGLCDLGKNAQAAFYAQQAGEKALKAYWLKHDLDPWGHSLGRLLRDLPEPLKAELTHLREAALHLDKLYIPTRYPDALVELTPAEAFTPKEAQAAIAYAQSIIEAISEHLKEQE
jgi:HEPN domain-containing protein